MASKRQWALEVRFLQTFCSEVQAEHERGQLFKSKGEFDVVIWDYYTLTLARM